MNKARQFIRKNSATIAVTIIFLSIVGIIYLQAISLATQSEQIRHQNELLQQIKQSAAERTSQINAVDKHIDCMVKFFAQNDRSSKAIANIETCRIAANKQVTKDTNAAILKNDQQNNTQPQTVQKPAKQPTKAKTSPKPVTKPTTPPAKKGLHKIPIVDGLLNVLGL